MTGNDKIFHREEPIGNATSYIIVAFISIALYNVVELNFAIFGTFKRRGGLYFWSFLIATWGIAPNAIGYLLNHLALTKLGDLYSTLIVVGWCPMVTGQSVVLYSRLHLVTQNLTALRAILIMIITNAILMHIPIIVLVYGSNSDHPNHFLKPYSIFEKLQLTVFFVQETIISSFYIWETIAILKSKLDIQGRPTPKNVMSHLIWVNVVVILLDISIMTLEFADYYRVQTAYKPLVYSIKLKMEFSILNRLVELAQNSTQGSLYAPHLTHATTGVAPDNATVDGRASSRCTGGDSGDAHISVAENDEELHCGTTAMK